MTVLNESRIESSVLILPPIPLARKHYEAVNKCLEAMGGRWNRKAKGHVFECDPSELLETALRSGEVVDEKKEFQFFPTPKPIVARMIALAELEPGDDALEPSAGRGAIAEEVQKVCPVTCVELNPRNCAALRAAKFPTVLEMDFLRYVERRHNKIVMNPPFSRGQDIDHILHAYEILEDGGMLVSVVSESPFFRDNHKSVDFRAFLDREDAEVTNLEPGAFAESGTGVKSRIICVRKP
jgi:predicted RNA methylase